MAEPLPALALLELATYGESRVRRRRLTLPVAVLIIALVYVVFMGLLATNALRLNALEPGITVGDWARAGAVLMVLLLVLLVWHARRRKAALAEELGVQERVTPLGPPGADEIVMTAESWQGLRVLEYSRPPKSEHRTAVYAKCLVPVDPSYVVRVEDLVAEARD